MGSFLSKGACEDPVKPVDDPASCHPYALDDAISEHHSNTSDQRHLLKVKSSTDASFHDWLLGNACGDVTDTAALQIPDPAAAQTIPDLLRWARRNASLVPAGTGIRALCGIMKKHGLIIAVVPATDSLLANGIVQKDESPGHKALLLCGHNDFDEHFVAGGFASESWGHNGYCVVPYDAVGSFLELWVVSPQAKSGHTFFD